MIDRVAPRNAAVDFLRLALAAMVIAIHTNIHAGADSLLNFVLSNGLFRVAVPTFFVINGYYLFAMIDARRSIRTYLWRIFILLVLWTAIYLPFFYPGLDTNLKIYVFLRTVLIGYFHLWYLVALIGGVIMLYLLRKRTDRQLLVLSLILFLIGTAMQLAASHLVFSSHKLNILLGHDFVFRNFLFMGFPFVTIGYLLARNAGYRRFATRFSQPGYLVLFVVLMLAESAANYVFRKDDDLDFLVTQFILSPLLFIFCLNQKATVSTRLVADVATGIYLVHVLVMKILLNDLGMAMGPGLFLTTLSISAAVATGLALLGEVRGPRGIVRYLI